MCSVIRRMARAVQWQWLVLHMTTVLAFHIASTAVNATPWTSSCVQPSTYRIQRSANGLMPAWALSAPAVQRIGSTHNTDGGTTWHRSGNNSAVNTSAPASQTTPPLQPYCAGLEMHWRDCGLAGPRAQSSCSDFCQRQEVPTLMFSMRLLERASADTLFPAHVNTHVMARRRCGKPPCKQQVLLPCQPARSFSYMTALCIRTMPTECLSTYKQWGTHYKRWRLRRCKRFLKGYKWLHWYISWQAETPRATERGRPSAPPYMRKNPEASFPNILPGFANYSQTVTPRSTRSSRSGPKSRPSARPIQTMVCKQLFPYLVTMLYWSTVSAGDARVSIATTAVSLLGHYAVLEYS